MNLRRTFDLIPFQLSNYPSNRCLVTRQDQTWVSYSTTDCQNKIDAYSKSLLGLGIKKGDRVLIIPHLASAEWIFLDLAIQQIGAIVVPIHFTSNIQQFHHIAQHTKAKVCFIGNHSLGEKFLSKEQAKPDLQVFFLDGQETEKDSLAYLLKHYDIPNGKDLETIKAEISESDLSAIIYTSGTTGIPKGVMLTHKNIISNVKVSLPIFPIYPGMLALSFLPFSHIFERMAVYTYLAAGPELHLLVDRNYLTEALKEVRPHIFTSVPRILEKMYEQVLANTATKSWSSRRLIHWALEIGRKHRERPISNIFYWLKWQLARVLVLNRLKRNMGGRVQAILVGAAHLQPALGRLMGAMGIKARVGYGMTETAAVVTVNRFRPGLFAFGTVGLPVPGISLKINQPNEHGEGEILVKGPNVMLGYYKQPHETKAVLNEEGWLHTGDIGKFVKKRFLQITDRKKDIFKTSAGKYIAPQMLENHFKQSTFIEQIMILGFKRPFVTAIIKPNFELLETWCKENKIHWTSPIYMALNIKVKQKIQEEVQQLNESLANYQTIRKFHLIHQEWTIESGLLTYTMKLVRPKILEAYQKEVDQLYVDG